MTSIKHLLIDGDIILYRTCFACKDTSLSIAKSTAESTILGIAESLNCSSGTLFLTGRDQFRKKVDSEYKANRKGSIKPPHIQELREYLVEEFEAVSLPIIEADDGMGILQCTGGVQETSRTCICTTDKDLDQVPGWHYNFNSRQLSWITPSESA